MRHAHERTILKEQSRQHLQLDPDVCPDALDSSSVDRAEAQVALQDLGLRVAPADMLRSVESADPDRLLMFLKAGMPVDSRDSREWTPLMAAAFHGNAPAARLLIVRGADLAARDRGGYTPLHWAALRGHHDVVVLVAPLVDVNLQSSAGLTPLLQAATAGHLDVARALVRAGADPRIATSDGWTPLHKAIANRNRELVEVLLEAGGSAFARHESGATPYSLAKAGRCVDMLQIVRSSPVI
jgi:ankyrin repeat protein